MTQLTQSKTIIYFFTFHYPISASCKYTKNNNIQSYFFNPLNGPAFDMFYTKQQAFGWTCCCTRTNTTDMFYAHCFNKHKGKTLPMRWSKMESKLLSPTTICRLSDEHQGRFVLQNATDVRKQRPPSDRSAKHFIWFLWWNYNHFVFQAPTSCSSMRPLSGYVTVQRLTWRWTGCMSSYRLMRVETRHSVTERRFTVRTVGVDVLVICAVHSSVRHGGVRGAAVRSNKKT